MALTIFDLSRNNPWWTEVKRIEEDCHVSKFNASKIQWRPALWRYIDLDRDDYIFYSIRGPRQVGKTTSIKLKIKELLERPTDPQSIFFWPCDQVSNDKQLTKLVETYINHSEGQGIKRKYIFLDEITSVKNWPTSVKYLYDTGQLKRTALVVNGSHSLKLKDGSGELAGRTGGDPDCHKMLVPMKFAEFATLTDPVLAETLSKKGLARGAARREILDKLLFADEFDIPFEIIALKERLDVSLNKYLVCGGVSRAINEYFTTGTIGQGTFDTYVEGLKGDLGRLRRDERIVRSVLKELVGRIGSLASWNDLAKEIDTSQPNVKNYIYVLEHCFLLTYLHRTTKLKNPKSCDNKAKKIYFEDPFLFHAIRQWCLPSAQYTAYDQVIEFLQQPDHLGHLVENVVANHLIRYLFDLHPSSEFQYNKDLFYYQFDSKKEIDFIVNHPKGVAAIEVKYQSSLNSNHYDSIKRASNETGTRGMVISKGDIELRNDRMTIPASIFLMLV